MTQASVLPATARAPRWRSALSNIRPSAALIGFAMALIIAMAGLTAGLLWHTRKQAVDEATRELKNLNPMIALQPFRQVESALARKHEGTGLGLPLVKAFTEMHGATLTLDSTRDSGTVARIVMPAERIVAAAPTQQAVR